MLYVCVNLLGRTAITDTTMLGDVHYIQEVNTIDNLTFTVYPQDPSYSFFFPKISYITAYDTVRKIVIFIGRVYSIEDSSSDGGSRKVECEGAAGFLKDSFVRSMNCPEGQHIMSSLGPVLINHNYMVDRFRQFNTSIRYVEPTKEGETGNLPTEVNLDAVTTFEALQSLVDTLGWEWMIFRQTNGQMTHPYFSVVIGDRIGAVVRDPIATGLNLKELTKKQNGDKIVTRLFPFGGVGYNEQRLSLTDYGMGSPISLVDRLAPGSSGGTIVNPTTGMYANCYVENKTLVDQYGLYSEVVIFDDIVANSEDELPAKRAELRERTMKYAEALSKISPEFDVKAYDLWAAGYDIDEMRVYNFYTVIDTITNNFTLARLTKKDISYSDPMASELTFTVDGVDKASIVD